MALSTELYGLKSAGVYRFEKDQSVIQNTVEPLDNIRMLVGFSKVGPFNTPVYITTTKEFVDTFGEIDRTLEKKGAFFHRSCLAALSAGPIYALNLLKLDPEEDKVSAMQFATSATCEKQTPNPATNLFPYQGMYNIDTFYTPSEESFLYTIGRKNTYISDGTSTNDILNFTNIGKNPVSVVVTKSSEYNSSVYDVTCQEWYGKGNVPEYLHPTSYISDFFVDVYVFSGDWGGKFDTDNPYDRFASDIKFNKYFDKQKGLIRKKNASDTTDTLFAQFLNEPDVQLIGKYTGCLIPGFVDKNGHNMYIEYLINSDTNVNGLMCSVNEQIFDGDVKIDGDRNGIDMVGHSVYDAIHDAGSSSVFSDVNFLSYKGSLAQAILGGAGEVKSDNDDSSVKTLKGTYTSSDGEITITSYNENTSGTENTSDTLITPNIIKTNSTSSDVLGGVVTKWIRENSSDSKSYTLYAYYYAENNKTYLPMDKSGLDDLDKIYKYDGNKYFVFDNELVPIVSAERKLIPSITDSSLPESEKRDAQTGSETTLQNNINNKFSGYTPGVMNSNPIIRYKFKVVSNNILNLSNTNNQEVDPSYGIPCYVFDSQFCNAVYFNKTETETETDKAMFIEGSDIYKKRSSLGTNDYVLYKNNDSDLERVDIDWIDNIGNITKVGGYDITNTNYQPSYIIAKFSKFDGTRISANSLIGKTYNLDYKQENNGICVILGANNFNQTINVIVGQKVLGITPKDNEFFIPVEADVEDYSNVKVGNYVLADNGSDEYGNKYHRLTRIVTINGVYDEQNILKYRLVKCQDKISSTPITDVVADNLVWSVTEVFTKFVDSFTNYNVFTLDGFHMRKDQMPDGTDARQHEILDLLDENSEYCNLFNALIDRELIQFRYLVDTFGLGIEEMCKHQYTKLCQERKSAFAIINMPSVNDFKNSKDPSFVDRNSSVSAEFIAKGGDPNTNPSFLFSLPDIVNGSTWGAYYYPYLKVYSNYTTINVPPAAYVSNNYIAKYGAGSPWTLVAGQNRGVISGNSVVGVESSLVRDSRDWLEPAGINSIIYQNNIGCVIYANKTAKQTPKSALSSINCREACIYIQDGVEKILKNYLFETNTAQTRLEIKTLVDNFLDMVKNNGGVYDYKTIMDSSNNDAEVIDHNMGVIDIFIEPVKGLEILVQKLTILRTGAIASGTFE